MKNRTLTILRLLIDCSMQIRGEAPMSRFPIFIDPAIRLTIRSHMVII